MDERYFTRLWSRVDKNGPIHPREPELSNCWLWTGAKNACGYGTMGQRSKGQSITVSTHRVAWAATHGDPGRQHVLHSCDRPACCNPRHLRLGTHLDNMREMAGRNRRANNFAGLKNPHRRLGIDDVYMIYNAVLGGTPPPIVATRHGVTIGTIHKITNGVFWKELGLKPFRTRKSGTFVTVEWM